MPDEGKDQTTPPTTPPRDRIDAELERALFKRFWTWLVAVGSIVVVVVSGFSVIVSQAINSVVLERIDVALKKIADVEKRALDSAFKTSEKSAEASGSAEVAKAAVTALNDRIKAIPDVNALINNMQAAAASLATNPQFLKDVTDQIQKGFGTGRILGIVQVKDGKVYSGSNGVAFDQSTGLVTFPNPKGLPFAPVISDSQDNPYITDTHWIKKVLAPDKFIVGCKAMDTSNRTYPPHDFTAVVLGFEGLSR
jgi:hypothetical protein